MRSLVDHYIDAYNRMDVGAPLGQVMPIAFTSPLFGVLMGVLHGGEPLTLKTLVGMALTIGGIVVLTIG